MVRNRGWISASGSVSDWRSDAGVRSSPIHPRFGPSVPVLLSSAWQAVQRPFNSKIARPADASALDTADGFWAERWETRIATATAAGSADRMEAECGAPAKTRSTMRSLNMLQRVLFLMCPLLVCAPVPSAHARDDRQSPRRQREARDNRSRAGRSHSPGRPSRRCSVEGCAGGHRLHAKGTHRGRTGDRAHGSPFRVRRRCSLRRRAHVPAATRRRSRLRSDGATVSAQAEHVFVSFDTYLDRRTAYTFGVSASGVRVDRYYPARRRGEHRIGLRIRLGRRRRRQTQGWTAEVGFRSRSSDSARNRSTPGG